MDAGDASDQNLRDLDLETKALICIESAFRLHNRLFILLREMCRFLHRFPEENAWPVVDEVKDVGKLGARSAGCAAGSDIARNDANRSTAAC
jgi:hypothetical protein